MAQADRVYVWARASSHLRLCLRLARSSRLRRLPGIRQPSVCGRAERVRFTPGSIPRSSRPLRLLKPTRISVAPAMNINFPPSKTFPMRQPTRLRFASSPSSTLPRKSRAITEPTRAQTHPPLPQTRRSPRTHKHQVLKRQVFKSRETQMRHNLCPQLQRLHLRRRLPRNPPLRRLLRPPLRRPPQWRKLL